VRTLHRTGALTLRQRRCRALHAHRIRPPARGACRRHSERLASLEAVLAGVDAATMKAATAAATRLDAVADDVRRVSRRLDEACDASARAEAQHSDRLALLDGAVGEELRPAIGALRTQLEATSKECRKAKHRGAEGAAALAAAVDELRAGADATGEAIRRIDDKLRRCVLDDMLDSERETILSIAAARAEPLRVSALLNASASEQHEHARGLERRLQASPVRQCTPWGGFGRVQARPWPRGSSGWARHCRS
jgi:hypothetical protein